MADVSIIVPAYNQGRYLAQAIRSVREQSCADWELVVVDDGSTDDTAPIAARFDDPRIRVLERRHGGPSAARNAGIQATRAPLVAFLDADDAFMPAALATLRDLLRARPDVGMAIGFRTPMDAGGLRRDRPRGPTLQADLPELLLENDIPLDGVMIRRDWLERVGGFDESLETHEDWDLWLRLLLAGCRFARSDEVVVAYRVHAGQLTQDEPRMRRGALALWEKFFDRPDVPPALRAHRPAALAAANVRNAVRAFRAGRYDVGNADLVEAVALDPTLRRDGYERLVDLLRGWATDPRTPDPEAFLVATSRRVSPQLPGLRRQLRKATAAVILEPLFGASPHAQRAGRSAVARAIAYDPSWLRNRGVLRMLLGGWWPSPARRVV